MCREVGWILLVFNILGLVAGGLMMYIAWQHNPQMEYYENGVVHWASWTWIGFSWWGLIAIIPSLFISLLWLITHSRF